jgi:hypothetical protein
LLSFQNSEMIFVFPIKTKGFLGVLAVKYWIFKGPLWDM